MLSNEIRALMSQIGLGEGEQEHEVLEKYKKKGLPRHLRDAKEDEPTAEELAIDEGNNEEEKPEKKKKKNRAERQAAQAAAAAAAVATGVTPAAKEAVVKNEKAADKKAAAATADKKSKDKNEKKPAASTASNSATTAKAPVISLSRPNLKKAEPSKAAATTSEDSADEDAPAAVAPTPTIPLNKPSLPSAPAPSTIPADSSGAGLKWFEQATNVTLHFPESKNQSQAQGKKVSLTGEKNAPKTHRFILPATVDKCFEVAQGKYDYLTGEFDRLNAGRSSDARWLSTVMQSGTLSDKVAGMTLMIQEAPLYRMSILDKLLAMAHKQGRRENSMAIDALKDLFINNLLPPKRKLLEFQAQPYFKGERGATAPSESDLVYWVLEDALKKRYLDFLGILETGTHDEMNYIKKNRMQSIYELLLASPEREKILLSLLVNKLGDSDKKIASKVVYYLNELTLKHPGFKLALIAEIQQLLYRSNVAKRAQYYAIIFLNQMVFTKGETELSNKLIHVYFLLFKQFVLDAKKEKDEMFKADEKKRIRRKNREIRKAGGTPIPLPKEPVKAYGGSNSQSSKFEAKTGAASSSEANDALRSKLLGGLLTGINRALPYASVSALSGGSLSEAELEELKSKPMSQQTGEELVLSQMDVIFNLVHTTAFHTSIQALMLLYQVLSRSIQAGHSGSNIDRFYRVLYEKLLSMELLSNSSRHGLFLNLLYKSLKNDTNTERIAAFAKRILQVASQANPSFICAVLFLLSEVGKSQSTIQALLTQPQSKTKLSELKTENGKGVATMEEDEEEHFVDAPEEEEQPKSKANKKKSADAEKEKQKAKAVAEAEADASAAPKIRELYDPIKRDPQFSKASSSCLWELLVFLHHFHPSVQKFAQDLCSGVGITYAGDPLKDFTAMHFLDRFVYKNPKQKKANEDVKKVMHQSAFSRPEAKLKQLVVNTPAFLNKSKERVEPDVEFFHRYFSTKAVADEAKKAKKAKEMSVDATEEEEDAFADDLIEREMRKMDPDSWMDDDAEDGSGPEEDSDEDDAAADEDMEDMDMEGEEDGSEQELDFDGDDAPMDEVDDEDAAEAAALAEMEAGGDDDSEVEQDFSGDEEEDEFNFDESSDEDDEDENVGGRGGKDRSASVFASAEEFADLLNSANDTGKSAKQNAWEKSRTIENSRDKPKKGGANFYQSAPAPNKSAKNSSQKKRMGSGVASEKPSFKQQKRKFTQSNSNKGGKGGSHKNKKPKRK